MTDPQYAPDGRRAAYVRTTVNHKRDSYSSAIMVYDTESGISNPWTFGDNRNTSPRWSPDGRRLAFVSDRENGVPQLYIIDAAGGEAEQAYSLGRIRSNMGARRQIRACVRQSDISGARR